MTSSGESIWSNDRIRLAVTSACNINCFYCHNEGQEIGNSYIEDRLVLRIKQLMEYQCAKYVTITGGEPLLHPNLEGIVEAIRPNVTDGVSIITNGMNLTRSKIDALTSAGVTKFRVGIDSLNGKKSRPSRIYPAEFNAINAIDLLEAAPTKFDINVVVTKFNAKELRNIVAFCRERNISAKLFEHAGVRSFGALGERGHIVPIQSVAYESVIDAIYAEANVEHRYLDMGGANEVFQCGGFSLRYCRCLCPVGLCHLTGTRVFANGLVSACMELGWSDVMPTSGDLRPSIDVLRNAIVSGCGKDASNHG